MEIFNQAKNSLQFSGNLQEALILEQMPVTGDNQYWQVPLAQILRAAEAIPEPWESPQVTLVQKGQCLPDDLRVVFTKDGIINLILDDDGIHIKLTACGLVGAPCPLPKRLQDIEASLRQAHINFLEAIIAVTTSLKEGL